MSEAVGKVLGVEDDGTSQSQAYRTTGNPL